MADKAGKSNPRPTTPDAALLQNEVLQDKVQSLEGRLKTAIGDLNVAKKNAKFDKIALEGRTKAALVLEHTVATLRHDLQTNVERRQTVEEKMATIERSWQNERSLRLQDLHRHDAMSSDTKHAEKVAEATEGKWLTAEKTAQQLEKALDKRARELESQSRVNAAQAGEIAAQAAEIELLRSEVFELKRILLTRDGEISEERASTSKLRRELSRVRRDFIMSTSRRSEQQSAFIGSRRKGKRVAKAWTPGSGHNSGISRLEQSALQGARDMVSWDDVFMTKVKADLRTKANGRHSTGLMESSGGRQACRQAPDGGVATGRKEEPFAFMSRRGEMPTLDAGSTLLVAGSLFVGNGLGVKKTPTVFAGGSAKNICRKIVEEQSCSLVRPVADDCD